MFICRRALAAGRRAFVVTEDWLAEYGSVGEGGEVEEEAEEEGKLEEKR